MNSIDGDARSVAFKMRQQGLPLSCPFVTESLFVEPGTTEAAELSNDNKPEFYARFSGVMDMLIKAAAANIPTTPLGLRMGEFVLSPEQIPTITMLQHHWRHTLSRHMFEEIEPRLTEDEDLMLLRQCSEA